MSAYVCLLARPPGNCPVAALYVWRMLSVHTWVGLVGVRIAGPGLPWPGKPWEAHLRTMRPALRARGALP
eukprot:1452986-Lingulodinium_polyedra.AAC.1